MRRTTFILTTLLAGLASGTAEADDTTDVLGALSSYGFQDGGVSLTINAGNDHFTISGTSIQDAANRLNSQFPGGHPLIDIEDTLFPDIFGPGNEVSGVDFHTTFPSPTKSPAAIIASHPILNTIPIFGSLQFAGVDIQLVSAANSNTVTLNIVGTDIYRSFTGTSRTDAFQQLQDYVAANSNLILNELHNANAGATISDPVIGNPHSFLQSLAISNVSMGSDAGEATASGPGERPNPILSMTLEPEYYSAKGLTGFAVRVPVDYTWFFTDPR